jgi:hypothetical protein
MRIVNVEYDAIARRSGRLMLNHPDPIDEKVAALSIKIPKQENPIEEKADRRPARNIGSFLAEKRGLADGFKEVLYRK